MKKLVLLALSITSVYTQAQIGVNTADVTSTLTVNGSFSGKYVEVNTSTYQIKQDDYNIAYTGGNEEKGTFILPTVKNEDATFPGRIYYIKNLSSDKDLQIKTSGSELIRFGGSLEAKKTINLFPGRYVALIANNSTGNATWDLNILAIEEKLPEIKITEYLKISLPLDKVYLQEDALQIGNLTVWFDNSVGALTNGQLKCKIANNNWAAIWSDRIGTGNTTTTFKSLYSFYDDEWLTIKSGGTGLYTLQGANLDFLITNIALYKTAELYRITAFINTFQSGAAGKPSLVTPMITFFIEKVN